MGQASDDHSELYRAPRGTFQWLQTSPDEFSGHIHGEQRSQRSLNTSRHSGNTEKAPVTIPLVFLGQRSLAGDSEPTIPRETKSSPRQASKRTKEQSENGDG
ncbi:hypothetical protein CDL15_Pgr026468 [Punica granatum]|nr:hypothetical protein CDL15_Pgr026468 [Punica granatum]